MTSGPSDVANTFPLTLNPDAWRPVLELHKDQGRQQEWPQISSDASSPGAVILGGRLSSHLLGPRPTELDLNEFSSTTPPTRHFLPLVAPLFEIPCVVSNNSSLSVF